MAICCKKLNLNFLIGTTFRLNSTREIIIPKLSKCNQGLIYMTSPRLNMAYDVKYNWPTIYWWLWLLAIISSMWLWLTLRIWKQTSNQTWYQSPLSKITISFITYLGKGHWAEFDDSQPKVIFRVHICQQCVIFSSYLFIYLFYILSKNPLWTMDTYNQSQTLLPAIWFLCGSNRMSCCYQHSFYQISAFKILAHPMISLVEKNN